VETVHFFDPATGEVYEPDPLPQVPRLKEDGPDDENNDESLRVAWCGSRGAADRA
jgi:hypothetical protein